MKELTKKILSDKKLTGAILLGVLLISISSYALVKSNSSDKITKDESSTFANIEVLVPEEKSSSSKNSKLKAYRERSNKRNVDGNVDQMYVFKNDEEIKKKEDEFDEEIKSRTSALRETYNRKTTNNYDVKKDFTRKSVPSYNAATNSTVEPKEVLVVEKKRRRKSAGGSSGNMTGGTSKNGNNTSGPIKTYVFNNGRTVKNNSSIKLRLKEELVLASVTIPKNEIITGKVTFQEERIIVKVTSIIYKGSLYKIKLDGYGVDGQKGIYSENIISHDVAQKNIDNAIDNGSSKVNIPILGEVSVDFAKSKMTSQSVLVPDGTVVVLK